MEARKRSVSASSRLKMFFHKEYLKMCDFLKWLTLTLTLIAIPVFLIFLFISLYYCKVTMSLVLCAALWIVTYVNSKM